MFKPLDTVNFGFGEGVIVQVGGPSATPIEIYSPKLGLISTSADKLTLIARSVTFTLASLESLELAINEFRVAVATVPPPVSNVFSVALAEFERIRADADFGPGAPVDITAPPLIPPTLKGTSTQNDNHHDE